jgi:phosphoadenosine phosphosulfate reductase
MKEQMPLSDLRRRFGHLDGAELLSAMRERYAGRLAVISSFGAEAAVLLDLVAQVDKSLPVIFVDSRELFDETIAYQTELTQRLGLTDVRVIRPTPEEQAEAADLWRTDPDRCCRLRKVVPLERAAEGFDALVDGRKRFHGADRATIETIELGPDGFVKISPLARWDQKKIAEIFRSRDLPMHPLVAQGYRSIGCWPCSRPTGPDEPIRSGRWQGLAKTECGIHRTEDRLVSA